MVGGFCVAVYAAIFFYIYREGHVMRKMRRRADQAGQNNLSNDDDTKKDR